MHKVCPRCSGFNVRRSAVRMSEGSGHGVLMVPYRCRDCDERFWAVSTRALYAMGFIAVAIVACTVGWVLGDAWGDRYVETTQATIAASRFKSASQLAVGGNSTAAFDLAQMYARGVGVAANPQEARRWLERAATDGNAEAQYELGMALREGRQMVQDYEAAVNWLRLAAEGGNAQAQLELGRMFNSGQGVPVDNVRAYTWLNLAAAQGILGAVPLRDTVQGQLNPEQVIKAQAEARRLAESQSTRSAKAASTP